MRTCMADRWFGLVMPLELLTPRMVFDRPTGLPEAVQAFVKEHQGGNGGITVRLCMDA